jgi:hypothetical protein
VPKTHGSRSSVKRGRLLLIWKCDWSLRPVHDGLGRRGWLIVRRHWVIELDAIEWLSQLLLQLGEEGFP